MTLKNTSDYIEDYIKNLLNPSGIAEIRRAELADNFRVVPSQINYVIKTRFTESRGYLVESKRGGGGYIRIIRLNFSDQYLILRQLLEAINGQVDEQVFGEILDYLRDEGLLTSRETQLIFSLAEDRVLGLGANQIRASMLHRILQRLDRKG